MWTSIVIADLVVNMFSFDAPIREVPVREMTIAGYWTLNPQLGDPPESEQGVLNVNGVEGRVSSEKGWRFPETAEMNAVQALVRELLEPGDHLTVAPTGNSAVTIVDGRGNACVYQTSGRPEWQQLDAGPCETRTVWRGRALRQEIRIAAKIYVVRWYRSIPESDRLIETVVLKAAGSRDRSLIRIYDSDRVR
jgi:hypothetical protein